MVSKDGTVIAQYNYESDQYLILLAGSHSMLLIEASRANHGPY